jgi:hypothetical protein
MTAVTVFPVTVPGTPGTVVPYAVVRPYSKVTVVEAPPVSTVPYKSDEVINVRKCSDPEEKAKQIYDALNFKYVPFVRKKSVVLKTELLLRVSTQNKKVIRI